MSCAGGGDEEDNITSRQDEDKEDIAGRRDKDKEADGWDEDKIAARRAKMILLAGRRRWDVENNII